MNNFYNTLAYITDALYAPARFTVDSVQEEPQNAGCGAEWQCACIRTGIP